MGLDVVCPSTATPIDYFRERVIPQTVIRKSRREQTRIVRRFSVIRMGGEQDPNQAAPRVHCCIPENGANLPIDKLTLPSAGPDQDYRHSCL